MWLTGLSWKHVFNSSARPLVELRVLRGAPEGSTERCSRCVLLFQVFSSPLLPLPPFFVCKHLQPERWRPSAKHVELTGERLERRKRRRTRGAEEDREGEAETLKHMVGLSEEERLGVCVTETY